MLEPPLYFSQCLLHASLSAISTSTVITHLYFTSLSNTKRLLNLCIHRTLQAEAFSNWMNSRTWSYWIFDSWESNFTCCGKDVRISLTKQPSVGILLSPTLPKKVLRPLVLSSGSFQNPTYIVSKSRLLVIPRDFRVTGLKRIGSYLFLLAVCIQKPQLAQLRE